MAGAGGEPAGGGRAFLPGQQSRGVQGGRRPRAGRGGRAGAGTGRGRALAVGRGSGAGAAGEAAGRGQGSCGRAGAGGEPQGQPGGRSQGAGRQPRGAGGRPPEARGGGCCGGRHQIAHALFQVLWIVHAEYDDTAVPPLFRQLLFQSGQALGAIRWLTSLQRQCEYMAIILRSSQVPSSVVSGVAMSMLGRRSILALAQRMMASFYTAVSEPITLKPGNIVKEWRGSCGTATELSEATVRMIISKCATMGGSPALVLSVTMTVWLPGMPPQRVHEYLCNEQRRGEWDTFANTGAVQELTSVITHPYLRGNNVVSVLEARDVPDQTNSNMLIMQEATSDVSCSLLVYSSIERNLIHAVMNGGDNTSIYLLPSGFAILPDGHGKTHRAAAASSSSAPTGHNGTAGSLLTAAYQALLPNNPSNHEAGTFNNAGNRVCNAINQILAAIGADIAVPS
ncbi:homeobox-leucine zipper protein ROC6-like [Setaria viridis]|uniref:homeobox-leucine zipper protein ROC6-like n=1 Tax=Setaria viridis TaxID=4556 RepID=UPI0014934F8D|nr:homeobox-leucine zipper protein ROC6-like [Setaria viridis]